MEKGKIQEESYQAMITMKAVILAAGEGTRLKPYTETIPKVMLPVANKPIIAYVVDALRKSGITEIIIVVGYKKEAIMEYFKDYTNDINITYVTQEQQLGTAHALLQARNYIKDTFLVLSGDNIIDHPSIAALIKTKTDYAMLIKKHPQPSKYGVVSIDHNQLKEIIEKPAIEEEMYISTGIYKLPPSIFDDIETYTCQGLYALTLVIQSIVNRDETISTMSTTMWKDIIYPWDLITVNATMMQTLPAATAGTIEKGVTIKGPVHIGKDTKIYAGTYITGPVVIGEGCEIGPNACIFPSTSIGNNTVIYPFCTIRDSVIMNNVHLGANSFLSHSIIGKGSVIKNSCSTIPEKTTIEVEGEFNTLPIIGAMIGDDCTIESNVVIQAGSIIGRNCMIHPLTTIRESIPSYTKVM